MWEGKKRQRKNYDENKIIFPSYAAYKYQESREDSFRTVIV